MPRSQAPYGSCSWKRPIAGRPRPKDAPSLFAMRRLHARRSPRRNRNPARLDCLSGADVCTQVAFRTTLGIALGRLAYSRDALDCLSGADACTQVAFRTTLGIALGRLAYSRDALDCLSGADACTQVAFRTTLGIALGRLAYSRDALATRPATHADLTPENAVADAVVDHVLADVGAEGFRARIPDGPIVPFASAARPG